MELDGILESWKEQNEKLNACIRLNLQLISESRLRPAKAALRPLTFSLIFELAMNIVAIGLLWLFSWTYRSQPQFVIPAIVLDIYVIALNTQLFRQILLANTIDYSAPVTEIQERLARISVERVRGTVWTFISAPVMWSPLLIVGLKGCLRVDAYKALGFTYLAANLLVCSAFTYVAALLLKRNEAKLCSYPVIQRLARDIAGKSLATAKARVAEVQVFLEGG